MSKPLRWGVAPGPTGAIRPWTRTSASAGPFVDELRIAQFIEQADSRQPRCPFDGQRGPTGRLEELRSAQFFHPESRAC
ncbi:hypothetical protein, partial [Polyangium sp. 15x6]|uniref:hypothetical protein n=1 Tax=Polyangium sp. 15x6 TaxID=3042687 RepID=UPI00249B9586